MQPVLDAELARHRDHGPLLRGVDLEPILETASRLLADEPQTGPQLRAALAERFPAHDAAALAYACRCRLALVQVPPRGVWGRSSQARVTTAASWLGRPLSAEPSLDEMVLRYLAAFGPATRRRRDAWCGSPGCGRSWSGSGPASRRSATSGGRELFDLPEAPRPGPDAPAPPRFLPEYDNVLLSHADRTRFVPEGRAGLRRAAGLGHGTLLHDGVVRGVWRLDRDRAAGDATLRVLLGARSRSARRRRSRPRDAATCGSPRPTPGGQTFAWSSDSYSTRRNTARE